MQDQQDVTRGSQGTVDEESNAGKFKIKLPGSLPGDQGEPEDVVAFKLEFLPGSVKSRWAQQYQFDRNQAIENSLAFKGRAFDKLRTKGRFDIENQTNAGNWLKDR